VFLTETLYFICIDKHIGLINVKLKIVLALRRLKFKTGSSITST